MTSIALARDRIHRHPLADDATGMACPRCHAYLLIHQPDQQLPDRLLGTCYECRTWFLINATAGVIVRLPDEEELERARSTSLKRLRSGHPVRSATTPGSRR